MPRPHTNDPRFHQINVRVSARELARIHHHASLTGKSVTEFGRAVMLRRPRPRAKTAPEMIALTPAVLARWQALGMALNHLAHHINATHEIAPLALTPLLKKLRPLLHRSLPHHVQGCGPITPYTLAPATRYHLRKVCTNLVQIADVYRALNVLPPLPLSHLIARFRIVMNRDHPAHGP